MPKKSQRDSSHCCVLILNNIVLDALLKSVTCFPVKFHNNHASTVPTSALPSSIRFLISASLSINHLIFSAEKYEASGRPHFSRSISLQPCSAINWSAVSFDRESHHTIARCKGFPLFLSHTIVVSRWLVTPIHLICSRLKFSAKNSCTVWSMHFRALLRISFGHSSNQPSRGKYWVTSILNKSRWN